MMNRWNFLLAGMILCAAAPSALGAGVDAKERAAKKACLLGDVNKGADILADLYVETNNPVYIYNQGRCFEQNGRNEQAVLRFKEYLRKNPSLRKADADALLKRIDELQGSNGRQEPPAPAPAPEPKAQPIEPPARDLRPVAAEPPSEPQAPALVGLGTSESSLPEPEPSTPIYKQWWFWTGIGAVVAGGVATAILLTRKSAPKSPACDGLGPCVQ